MTTWMISLVLLFAAKVIHQRGFDMGVLVKSFAVIFAVLVFTSVIKYLKKSGHLTDVANSGQS